MAIDMVKIRAKITIGTLIVKTPYILSFNVSKVRGQVSTFSASLKVSHSDVAGNIVGNSIKIEAGEDSPKTVIFQGIVRKATISPVFDDPNYVSINLSGEDILSLLKNKRYTRRCISTQSVWYSINGVTRKGFRSSKFKARKVDNIQIMNTEAKENPAVTTTASVADDQSKKRPHKDRGRLAPHVSTRIIPGANETGT